MIGVVHVLLPLLGGFLHLRCLLSSYLLHLLFQLSVLGQEGTVRLVLLCLLFFEVEQLGDHFIYCLVVRFDSRRLVLCHDLAPVKLLEILSR